MKITRIFLFFTLIFSHLAVLASEVEPELNAVDISTVLYKIEADIKDERFLLDHLNDYLEKLPTFTSWAEKCVVKTTSKLKDNTGRLEKLGEFVEGEPSDVAFIRKDLSDNKNSLASTQASCKAILVRSETAIKNISQFRTDNLERKSFDRGINILVVLQQIIPVKDFSESRLAGLLESSRGINVLKNSELIMLLGILIFTTIIGILIRSALSRWESKNLKRWQERNPGKADTSMRFFASLMMTVRRYILPILLSTSLAVFIAIETSDQVPTPLIAIFTYDLPLLFVAFAIIFFSFKALPELGLRASTDKETFSSLRLRLNILAIVIFLGHLLFQTILANSLPEAVFFLARATLGLILVLNLIWAVWLTRNLGVRGLSVQARLLISLALVGALIAELTGYRNLSGFVIRGVTGTLVAYALFQLFSYLLKRFLGELNTGKAAWQKRLRISIGIKEGETIPGFLWIKFFTIIILWILFIAALLFVWGVPESDIRLATSTITQGFSIGSFKIQPLKIVEAILVLVGLLALNGWLQRRFEKKFLTMAGIERGARESIATIANYIGITLVIIISLAIAGMDFSKLAIIAGALSVGIGFGLQNVVNNFVSGLILLFERPIKTGDWIVAGGVEGTVKKISIRSTQIQSFDGADIIIPNSELISGNLINWELKQQHGRVRVPIGVAYGSDTSLVKEWQQSMLMPLVINTVYLTHR
jgi:small-conductance mechanosensitive channel